MTQLSFFSADVRPPAYADLEGLLAGPGHVVRREASARVSVVVADGWRVEALALEMTRLDLIAELGPGEQPGTTTVRTPFLRELAQLADAWSTGAVKLPPEGFTLDGPRLRWWCLAAGARFADGYRLSVGPADELAWPRVGAALAAAGLAGAFVGPRADGPAYRIVGARRLARLAELVGAAPQSVPATAWPPLPGERLD